ncbi:hypothetical protein N7453_000169 [Penicillium expansum]|nr:hypothetical protein N7453_000169 [Penicillium expansum]
METSSLPLALPYTYSPSLCWILPVPFTLLAMEHTVEDVYSSQAHSHDFTLLNKCRPTVCRLQIDWPELGLPKSVIVEQRKDGWDDEVPE